MKVELKRTQELIVGGIFLFFSKLEVNFPHEASVAICNVKGRGSVLTQGLWRLHRLVMPRSFVLPYTLGANDNQIYLVGKVCWEHRNIPLSATTSGSQLCTENGGFFPLCRMCRKPPALYSAMVWAWRQRLSMDTMVDEAEPKTVSNQLENLGSSLSIVFLTLWN